MAPTVKAIPLSRGHLLVVTLPVSPYLEFLKLFHPIFSPCPVEEGSKNSSEGIWLLAQLNLSQFFFSHPTWGAQIWTGNLLICSQMLLAQVNPPWSKPAPFKTFLIAGQGSCPDQRSGLPWMTSLTEFLSIIISRAKFKAAEKCMWLALLQARTRQLIKVLNIFSETWLNKSSFKSTFAQSKSTLTYRYSHRRDSKREFLWRLLHTDIQVRHSFFAIPSFLRKLIFTIPIILHVKLSGIKRSSM